MNFSSLIKPFPGVFFFRTIILFLLLDASIVINAQHIIHGKITDKSSGEFLIGATIVDTVSGAGVIANEYGFYSLKLKNADPVIKCSFVGYAPKYLHLFGSTDTVLNFALEASLELEEVEITADAGEQAFAAPQMSFHNLNSLQVKKLPALMGEVDLIKALQYLPGVSSGMEGTSGIYVRGGSSDQNLILLDGVPVYNVNHLFGFFSVFNGEAINNASMYKAGFPARYSGRLSSVIDIRMKEGNMQEFHGSASIGIIGSNLMLEGPIIKDKTSFLVSARRTYIDILSYPIQFIMNKTEGDKDYIGYYFHDLNAKINHKFSDRSRLYLSAYAGKDEFYDLSTYMMCSSFWLMDDPDNSDCSIYTSRYGFNWGNITSSLRWNYTWGSQFFSNLTLAYSKFRFSNFETSSSLFDPAGWGWEDWDKEASMVDYSDIYYSGIKEASVKMDFSYLPSAKHTFRFGIRGSRFFFEPGVSLTESDFEKASYEDIFERNFGDTVHAKSLNIYIEDEFVIGQNFKANAGVSSTAFLVEGVPYVSLEPRLSARYMLSDKMMLKASYAKMSQHVHLLTNSLVGLPTDTWVPTTSRIEPEKSYQYAAGINYKISPGLLFSLEGYYKTMEKVVEYEEGANLWMNKSNWEDMVEVGTGTAYGIECFMEKTDGRLTGSVAYTWSKNFRSFENIQNGRPFPYKYDRRHDVSLVANYRINERVFLGATWVYASGVNTTIHNYTYYNPLEILRYAPGEGEALSDNYLIKNFDLRNGYKNPDYHRLDLGISIDKKKKRYTRTWSFGAYNAYNHKNSFYVDVSDGSWEDSDGKEKRVYQVTLFPIIPYFRYSIKF